MWCSSRTPVAKTPMPRSQVLDEKTVERLTAIAYRKFSAVCFTALPSTGQVLGLLIDNRYKS